MLKLASLHYYGEEPLPDKDSLTPQSPVCNVYSCPDVRSCYGRPGQQGADSVPGWQPVDLADCGNTTSLDNVALNLLQTNWQLWAQWDHTFITDYTIFLEIALETVQGSSVFDTLTWTEILKQAFSLTYKHWCQESWERRSWRIQQWTKV